MNERIKELAEQAGFGYDWFEESKPGDPALPREGMLEHFADLIVKECFDSIVNECIELCNDAVNSFTMYGMQEREAHGAISVKELIKHHFGVK